MMGHRGKISSLPFVCTGPSSGSPVLTANNWVVARQDVVSLATGRGLQSQVAGI